MSKSQVDRLGERLRDAELTASDLRALAEYRASFVGAYLHVFETIRDDFQSICPLTIVNPGLAWKPTTAPAWHATFSANERAPFNGVHVVLCRARSAYGAFGR